MTGTSHSGIGALLDPPRLVIAAIIFVAVSIAFSYAVDVHDAFGLRTRMSSSWNMNHPGVWYQIFGSRKIAEVLQWLALAAAVPLSAATAGRFVQQEEPQIARFWSFVSVGLAGMLLEDAGNVRDIVTDYAADMLPRYGDVIRLAVLLTVFGAIGAVMAYAAYRFGGQAWVHSSAARPYLVTGYVMLFVGAVSDPLGLLGLYEPAGRFVHEVVGQGQMIIFPDNSLATQSGMLIDSVYEESLELIGYTAFLAAALSAYRTSGRRPVPRSADVAVSPAPGSAVE